MLLASAAPCRMRVRGAACAPQALLPSRPPPSPASSALAPRRPGAALHATPRRCRRASAAGSGTRAAPLRRVTTCGLPIPIIGGLFSPPVLTVAWAFGAFRLFSGFSKTSYTDTLPVKLALCALWPVLFAASAAFRDNFKRAL